MSEQRDVPCIAMSQFSPPKFRFVELRRPTVLPIAETPRRTILYDDGYHEDDPSGRFRVHRAHC